LLSPCHNQISRPGAAFCGKRTGGVSRRPSLQAVSFGPEGVATPSMKNGLYSIHIHMLDGVKGRDSGILIL
jgi:hypothetical protein